MTVYYVSMSSTDTPRTPRLRPPPRPARLHRSAAQIACHRKSRLNPLDIAYILKSAAEGHEQKTIADRLRCTQPSVSKVLRQYTPTDSLAKQFIKSTALIVAKASVLAALKAARRGRGEECLDILDRLDVLPKRQEDGRARVQIAVMMPGQTLQLDAAPPTFVDVLPASRGEE